MENVDEMVLTIKKIRFVDKWAEFWFEEQLPTVSGDPEDYHLSSKVYKLWDAVRRAGMEHPILEGGFAGKKLRWERQRENWEIVDFVKQEEPNFYLDQADEGHWLIKSRQGLRFTAGHDKQRAQGLVDRLNKAHRPSVHQLEEHHVAVCWNDHEKSEGCQFVMELPFKHEEVTEMYERANEIFERHWLKRTGKPLDALTRSHLQYAIDAVFEALSSGK